jgi:hypothetical protein
MHGGVGVSLFAYRDRIHLDEPYIPTVEGAISEAEYQASIDYVLDELLREHPKTLRDEIPEEYNQRRALIRALLTVFLFKDICSCPYLETRTYILCRKGQERVSISEADSFIKRNSSDTWIGLGSSASCLLYI